MNKTICFTGKLNHFTRKSAQDVAKANSFDVWSGVKKGLDYLVAADPDSGSSKMCKAEELGITIISESEFMKMCHMEVKRTIYDVLNDEEGKDSYTTRDELLDCVKDILGEVYEYGSGAEELEEKGISYDKFCNDVTDLLLSGKIDFDESWDNGEVYMQIENTATDVLIGNPIGTKNQELCNILGTNENGQMQRCFGPMFEEA